MRCEKGGMEKRSNSSVEREEWAYIGLRNTMGGKGTIILCGGVEKTVTLGASGRAHPKTIN